IFSPQSLLSENLPKDPFVCTGAKGDCWTLDIPQSVHIYSQLSKLMVLFVYSKILGGAHEY
ncbi:MAG: hypothetical protein V3W19_05735, partial [Desulfatiglandales bacterium]